MAVKVEAETNENQAQVNEIHQTMRALKSRLRQLRQVSQFAFSLCHLLIFVDHTAIG